MSNNVPLALISLEKDLADVLIRDGHHLLGGFDPSHTAGADMGLTHLGTDDVAINSNDLPGNIRFVLAIDPPDLREKLATHYGLSKLETFIAKSATISKFAKIGCGSVVQCDVKVLANANVGIGCKLNVGAQIHHDVELGDYTTVAPAAVVLGGVQIGKKCYIGANATILPNIKIGDCAVIGAGAVVHRDVDINTRMVGVPAYQLNTE